MRQHSVRNLVIVFTRLRLAEGRMNDYVALPLRSQGLSLMHRSVVMVDSFLPLESIRGLK